MKKILFAFAVAGLTFSSIVYAQEEDFAKRKQKILQSVDRRLSFLQEEKSCITAAKDQEALRACHESMQQKRKDMMKQDRAEREEMINQQIQQLQERKKKLGEER